jgi:hypothetical protein
MTKFIIHQTAKLEAQNKELRKAGATINEAQRLRDDEQNWLSDLNHQDYEPLSFFSSSMSGS